MPSANAEFLSDFIDSSGNSNGNSFTYGNLTFSNFSYHPNNLAPLPANVTVSGFTDVLGNQGITFGGAWTPTGGINPTDFRLTYQVSTSDPHGLTDVHMLANPTVTPDGATGAAIITETVSGVNPVAPSLGTMQVYSINNGGGTTTLDHNVLTFGSAYQSLLIQKDILLNNGTGAASVSFIDQTFSPAIPEPGSVVLMGLGCLGMVGYGLKRRQSMAV
jgi:hypothetical protein